MKTTFTQFTNLSDAVKYAKSIGYSASELPDKSGDYHFNRETAQAIERVESGLKRLDEAGFNIDGFSEVRPLIRVFDYVQEHDSCRIRDFMLRGFLLHLVDSNKDYFISGGVCKSGPTWKYCLSWLPLLDCPYHQGIGAAPHIADVAPNMIGKATKRKLVEWAEYADRVEVESCNWYAEMSEKRVRAIESIKNMVRVHNIECVWDYGAEVGEYRFQKIRATLTNPLDSAICINYEFSENGDIWHTTKINDTKAEEIAKSIINYDC